MGARVWTAKAERWFDTKGRGITFYLKHLAAGGKPGERMEDLGRKKKKGYFVHNGIYWANAVTNKRGRDFIETIERMSLERLGAPADSPESP